MIRRSAIVAIAVTLGQLVAGRSSGWTKDQELVLEALRRSTRSLTDASEAELSDYLANLSPEQMRGVVSNVKGIFHELLVVRAENSDGDELSAELFEATNHPGADVEFVLDGDVVREVQIKAVQTPSAILEHFSRYPETDVMAASEVTELLGGMFRNRVTDSGSGNESITQETRSTLEALVGEDLGDFMQDGLLTSSLLGGALTARSILAGRLASGVEMRSMLELAGISVGTAFTVETLLDLM